MTGKNRRLRSALLVLVWIGIIGGSFFLQLRNVQREERGLFLNAARAFFQQILLSRSWNASHSGVYVPVTATTQPNPYLEDDDRDLVTIGGLRLTKINPAYMTRQIAELAGKNESGIHFHLTSLDPINPENHAAPWENQWLESFEHGVKEQGDFFREGDTVWFRYMAPLVTETACLRCHALQGYKAEDIRGGLSVSLPYPVHSHLSLVWGYVLAAGAGIFFIIAGCSFYERKRLLFDATFDNAAPISVTDKHFSIVIANKSYQDIFGPLPGKGKRVKCFEHRNSRICNTDQCPTKRVLEGASKFSCEVSKTWEGKTRHFIVTTVPLRNDTGKLIGILENFVDITERKQAEKALLDFNRRLEIQCQTDGLTGIANRFHFDNTLALECARHQRSGKNLSLILLDVDYFKSFNDNYGHQQGDECLQRISHTIATCLSRPADLAARFGGEEFVCLLPETDSAGALTVAEKIRRAISELAVPHEYSDVSEHVTASLGVVTGNGNLGCLPGDVVGQADAALYRAKSSGRNRVVFSDSGSATGKQRGGLVQLIWQNSFKSGNELIDSQHRALFSLANELLDAVLSNRPASEVTVVLNRLLDDIRRHFSDEERILKKDAFPGWSQHAAEHTKLLTRSQVFCEECGTSAISIGDVVQFVAGEVVMKHLLGTDRNYFEFLRKRRTP